MRKRLLILLKIPGIWGMWWTASLLLFSGFSTNLWLLSLIVMCVSVELLLSLSYLGFVELLGHVALYFINFGKILAIILYIFFLTISLSSVLLWLPLCIYWYDQWCPIGFWGYVHVSPFFFFFFLFLSLINLKLHISSCSLVLSFVCWICSSILLVNFSTQLLYFLIPEVVFGSFLKFLSFIDIFHLVRHNISLVFGPWLHLAISAHLK